MQKKSTNCQSCTRRNTKRMVSCCHCSTWWHYECVGVNESISDEDREFTCPTCQKPSSWMPYEVTPNPSERSSVTGGKSGKSSASSRARKAQLELERLKALRELELKRLDLGLELDKQVLEATFRAREAELEDEDDDRSVSTQQSSFSKVTEWQNRQQQYDDVNSTMIPVSEAKTTTSGDTVGTVTQPGQGGVTHQPGSETGLLAGTPLHGSGSGLGGNIERTSDVTAPSGPRIPPLIPPHLSPIGTIYPLPVITEENQITPSSYPPPQGFLGNSGNNGEVAGANQVFFPSASEFLPTGAPTSGPPASGSTAPGQLPPIPALWSWPSASGTSTTGSVPTGAPPQMSPATWPSTTESSVPGVHGAGMSSQQQPATFWALGSGLLSQQPLASGPPSQLPPATPASRPLVPGRPAPRPPSQHPPTSGQPAPRPPLQRPPTTGPSVSGTSQLPPAIWPPASVPPATGGPASGPPPLLPPASGSPASWPPSQQLPASWLPAPYPPSVPLPGQQLPVQWPPTLQPPTQLPSVPGPSVQWPPSSQLPTSVPPQSTGPGSQIPVAEQLTHVGPTKLQVQARLVVPKELPIFKGRPEDWPAFISAYKYSTEACGFSDIENMGRLQKYVQGDARLHVESMLRRPGGVAHAMAQLEQLYGRPEILVHTLLRQIRDAAAPKENDPSSLVTFGLTVQNLCNTIIDAGQEAHLNNPELLVMLVGKLPGNWMMDWSMYQERCAVVNLQTFSQYMQVLVRAGINASLYQKMTPTRRQTTPQTKERPAKGKDFCGAHSVKESPKTPGKVESLTGTSRPSGPACYLCKHPKHRVKDCKDFAKQSVKERLETVKRFNLCETCLGAHWKRPCQTQTPCEVDGCQVKHHKLLHDSSQGKTTKKEEKKAPKEKDSESKAVTNHHSSGQMSLFRILPVTLYGNNRSMTVYAFLDDGSSVTLIDEDIVNQLGVTGEAKPLCLQWTSKMKRWEPNSQRITLDIAGVNSESKYTLKEVRTVAKLDLPRQSLRFSELVEAFPYLEGLPIDDYEEAAPCMLIGNDNAFYTLTKNSLDGEPGGPIAAESRLGWTVYGTNPDGSSGSAYSMHICECQPDDRELHDLVERYFAIESLGIMEVASPESAEVQRASRILQETTKRVGPRFEAGLLWRFDDFEFPDSYPMAVRRLQCLERRMRSDPVIEESVKRQMREYQEKNYIHKATKAELAEADPRRTWYLPLGVALNPKKPTKIRIFCDAAAKVNGISLNTMLLKGPDFLTILLEVLFGFRQKRIAICADLKEMFHQILLLLADRHAQRLVWREDESMDPEIFLMDVVSFGATCSPSIAQFVKNRNAEEHAEEFPEAANAIIRKHYVDDYLDSADDVEEAVKLALEVRHVHAKGGFHLRNWLSNSREVLARVGEDEPANEKCMQLDKDESTERVLGMFWRPETDVFTYSTTLATDTEHPTKRQALRVVMSPFDPPGLLCFFLVHGKILIQEMWRAKTGWDEKIPQKLCERWVRWTDMFRFLDQIRIPRCYFPKHSVKDIISLQLHIFVDASEEAFACVAYLRAEFPEGNEVALVAGKSKVAPLKALSIPRLELMAAVIGTRMMVTVIKGHSLKIDETVLWSDSKTVLAWINSDHRTYRQFVACRVGEILAKTKVEQWRWVPTKENVADEATKWGKGPCLSSSGRWFQGPEFLRGSEEKWPVGTKPAEEKTEEERRACMIHHEVGKRQFVKWENFSNWTRLCRAIAYVHRFVQRVRKRGNRRTANEVKAVKAALQEKKWNAVRIEPLEQEELAAAENTIFRWVQTEEYPDEMAVLTEAKDKQPRQQVRLEKSSPIRKTSPYVDELGVIRSDGRIAAATCITFSTKFPVILPKEHRVTFLLCRWYHQGQLHANRETVVNEMRQRFHVSALRQLVRRVAKECQWCKIRKPKLEVPREAPLPNDRLQAYTRPFTYVGVDYFGPINVRVNRSHVKRWIAVFTCMSLRSIHLEVVHTLTTESCKMAFRRFIATRGAPAVIHSDRGTNFVGANNELRKEMRDINGQLAETFTNANTKWVFNPPGAPHMGGTWERLVRSVKTALAAMGTSRTPNDETLATLVKEAESLVNSRPLTYMPLETGQDEALTPNHFLLLSSSGVVQPRKTLTDLKQACRNDWTNCQVMLDQFWRRWVREYLPTIARRTKWFEEVKPIAEGDLVIVVEDKERNGWYRGRVVEVIVGRDGRVRSAKVQTTANGIMHRPVAKLARLDVDAGKADHQA